MMKNHRVLVQFMRSFTLVALILMTLSVPCDAYIYKYTYYGKSMDIYWADGTFTPDTGSNMTVVIQSDMPLDYFIHPLPADSHEYYDWWVSAPVTSSSGVSDAGWNQLLVTGWTFDRKSGLPTSWNFSIDEGDAFLRSSQRGDYAAVYWNDYETGGWVSNRAYGPAGGVWTLDRPTVVPEPSTLSLVGFGLLGLIAALKQKGN